jgi:hypothetical protein
LRAGGDVFLREVAGNLRLGTVEADGQALTLSTASGSIVAAQAGNTAQVRAASVILEAVGGGIGAGASASTAATVLTTKTASLQASATAGDLLIANQGSLSLGAVTQTGSGAVLLQSSRDLTLSADLLSQGGPVSLLARGKLSLSAAADVLSRGGSVDIEAASGSFSQAAGSTIVSTSSASGAVDGAVRIAAATDLTLARLVRR